MNKFEVRLAVIAIMIAVITLLFGDNLYERFTGHSIADDWRELFSPEPNTPPNDENILFQENFDDSLIQEMDVVAGDWKIISENKNKILDIDNSNGSDYVGVDFGKAEWQNFTIQYQVKMVNFALQATPEVILYFRVNNTGDKNVQAFTPDYNGTELITLGKSIKHSGWQAISTQAYPFITEKWYKIKIIAQDNRFKIYVDDDLVIDTTDSQITSGTFTLQVGPGAHVQFDNILVSNNIP